MLRFEARRPVRVVLPVIDAEGLQFREKVSLALDAMDRANRTSSLPRFFQQTGLLVRLRHTDDGGVRTEPLRPDALRGELARVADWVRTTPSGKNPIDPPPSISRDILALPRWDFPRLRRVATVPYFSRAGRLIATPGYDRDEGVLLHLPPKLVIGDVPERPSVADVDLAKRLILEELFGDFPFSGDADRAHALGALLYPFVREIIDSPLPLHVVDAPTPGTGKGLLAQAIVLVSTGAYPGVVSEKDDNEELRKTITALLLEGASAVVIDNVTRKLGQVSLAALLTARTWRDRLLGKSKTVEVPNRTLWIVTGNNVAMNDEMARRSVRIRLDAGVEEPWHRQGFRHDPLLEWADEHRGELVWAALVLVANWLARGAEPFTERTLGSFEVWARVIGGVLRDAGIEGFLQGRQRMHSEADRDSASWAAFFEAWWREYGDRPMTAGELLAVAEDALPEVIGNGSDRSRSTRLGLALGRKRGRVFAGLRFQEIDTTDDCSRSRTAWSLLSVASEAHCRVIERLDVGAQAVVAQDKRPCRPNVAPGTEEGLE